MAIRINIRPDALKALEKIDKKIISAVQYAICKELGLPTFPTAEDHGDSRELAEEIYLAMDWPTFIKVK